MVRSFKTVGYFTKAVLKCKNQLKLMQISQLLFCVLVCLLEVNIPMIMLYMLQKKGMIKNRLNFFSLVDRVTGVSEY